MNYLVKNSRLKNCYVMLRHGESEANHLGLIISDPKNGIDGYGLTEKGKKQVVISVNRAKNQGWLDSGSLIYSSDFKRARETSLQAKAVLQSGTVQVTQALRERYFGDLENKSNKNYAGVWLNDAHKHATSIHKVESVHSVLGRVTQLITELERKYSSKTILLVSHADTLQILQTAFMDEDPYTHRDLKPFKVAEARTLPQTI